MVIIAFTKMRKSILFLSFLLCFNSSFSQDKKKKFAKFSEEIPVFLEEINDFPTICFMVGAVTRQHVGGDVRYEFFEVNFRGYVHGEDSLNLADDLSEDIDFIVNSFRNRALTSNSTLEISDALVLSVSTDEGLFDPHGLCDIRAQISYRYHLA